MRSSPTRPSEAVWSPPPAAAIALNPASEGVVTQQSARGSSVVFSLEAFALQLGYFMTKQRRSGRRASERDSSGLAARGAGVRSQRLEELFREELNSLLDIEVSDPALDGVRITRVELSGDGSRARAWFVVDALDANPARAALEHAARFLRSRLCDALPVKRIPDLTFRHDPAAQLPEEKP